MTTAASPVDHGRACLLITGPPGAGKSTVSTLVAQALTRSALLNGDQVSRLVMSGHVWPLGEPACEASRQVQLCNQNLSALAANFAGHGFTPIIDWVVPDRGQLDFYRQALHPHPLLLVVLAPTSDVCRHRNTLRPPHEQFEFEDHDSLLTSMHNNFGELGWWLDTSQLTAQSTARLIVQHAYDRAFVPDALT